MATTKPLTLAQARTIVGKFQTSSKVNAARVTSMLPHVAKSAATIVDEVYLAYHAAEANVPYAFGESTIQTALNVAKAWANLPASVKGNLTAEDTVTILDALVQVRRTPAKLPDRTIPKGVAVKRELTGKRKDILGGERALSHVMSALAKEADASKWVTIVTGAHVVLLGATNDVRRAGKVTPASDDDAATDVVTGHNGRAADAREGDERAEKQNRKATRKSKHERDPLEPAKPGNEVENLPGSGTSTDTGKAPAKILALADADLAATMRHMRMLLAGGATITPTLDTAFTALAEAWEEAARSQTTSKALAAVA